jgi:hypothetical protein
MTSILENPMPVVYVSAVVEAGLVFALVKTGLGRLIWAIFGVLLVTVLIVLVSWLVETDREKIAGVLSAGAKAVENNDIDGFLTHVAPESDVAREAKAQLPRLRFSKVTFLDDPKINVQGDNARATVNVVVVVGGMRGGRLVTIDFRRYGERWLAVTLQHDDLNLKDVFR